MRGDDFQVKPESPLTGDRHMIGIEGCPKSVYKSRTRETLLRTALTICVHTNDAIIRRVKTRITQSDGNLTGTRVA